MREQIEIARNDMGITHSDFQRIFPRLIEDCKNSIVGTETIVNWSSGQKLTVYVSKEKIRNMRQAGLETSGEFSVEYLAFERI